jgi:lipopolysaccharide transport system ATP-binding protein
MSDIAIRIEHLYKRYEIGAVRQRYTTLCDQLSDGLKGLLGRNGHRRSSENIIWALKDVSFEVKQGEIVGIIGRNGAGKSSLLKILTRITEPTAGRAEIYGRVGSLLEVGTGFHPELTGRENIYLNGAILGMRKAEIDYKFDEIVAFAEVEKFIDTPVKRYSSGMYVRLAFAVAAHLEPEILLVDEVLAVGDVAFQNKCLGRMGDVARGGRTVLFVSHNMAAMASLTHRSVWLEGGEIRAIGSTQEVLESYLNSMESDSQSVGFVSLTARPRPENGIVAPRAQLEWVGTRDREGNQRNIFAEGAPIVIELGFKVHNKSRNLEFGIGVKSLQHKEDLFLVPSPIYEPFLPEGRYCVRMSVDPNYLKVGSYTLVLKMFADGVRQETMGDTLQFRIIEDKSCCDKDGRYKVWISGFFRFDYKWGKIEPYTQWAGTEEDSSTGWSDGWEPS